MKDHTDPHNDIIIEEELRNIDSARPLKQISKKDISGEAPAESERSVEQAQVDDNEE
jgi:hypothetical protein